MKNKRTPYRLQAFSILEVTVVIALMALLSALFFGALNRFNEQIAVETTIKNELNNWFAVRSNLWQELDNADSVKVENNTAFIWKSGTAVVYSIENDKLIRTRGKSVLPMEIEMNTIALEQKAGLTFTVFSFNWKNEEMKLSYPHRSRLADRINTYFLTKEWQQ